MRGYFIILLLAGGFLLNGCGGDSHSGSRSQTEDKQLSEVSQLNQAELVLDLTQLSRPEAGLAGLKPPR